MNIGDLNKRIIFQTLTTITSENGFDEEVWENYKIVWAKIENLYGREYYSAMAVQAEKTTKFTIRYCKDIDETMRIKFGKKIVSIKDSDGNVIDIKEVDRQYNITFIDDIKYRHEFMEVKALEVENG